MRPFDALPRIPPPHLVVARVRTLTARRPALRRLVRLVLVLALTAVCWSLTSALDTERRRWGDTVTVLVATAPLRPGDSIDSVDIVEWPVALAPLDALAAGDTSGVVRRDVGPGEVLVAGDIATRTGVAALVPDGWSAVPVPASSDQRTTLSTGDTITVIVDGRSVTDGTVVAVGDESVTVAVPDRTVAAVADAVLRSTAALALTPGPPHP